MPNVASVKSQSSRADDGKKRITEFGGTVDGNASDPNENEPAIASDQQQANDSKPDDISMTDRDNPSINNETTQENTKPRRTIQSAMTKVQGSASEGTGTSISSQIQKIIARELVPSGKKGKIDLQSIPMREYLEQTVIPIVHQGMLALARERPESPIEYLAAYFLKHKNKYQYNSEITEPDNPSISKNTVRPSQIPPPMATPPQIAPSFYPNTTPIHQHLEHAHHPHHHSHDPPH